MTRLRRDQRVDHEARLEHELRRRDDHSLEGVDAALGPTPCLPKAQFSRHERRGGSRSEPSRGRDWSPATRALCAVMQGSANHGPSLLLVRSERPLLSASELRHGRSLSRPFGCLVTNDERNRYFLSRTRRSSSSLRSSSRWTSSCSGTSCSTRARMLEVAQTVGEMPRRSKCAWFRGSLTRAIVFGTL